MINIGLDYSLARDVQEGRQNSAVADTFRLVN